VASSWCGPKLDDLAIHQARKVVSRSGKARGAAASVRSRACVEQVAGQDATALPQTLHAAGRPRRSGLSSMTSSCRSVAE
jgi:hypothetical protein